ncbi:sporulation protein YqfD [Sporosarcina sp. USHLN248]|uniref:sporulation protein YqfD n=1 Tax=Sporosarcina sp. USHLN248 TaxID=3081300 RepID=UPI003017B777
MRERFRITLKGKTDLSRFISFLSSEGVKLSYITEDGGMIRFQTDRKGMMFIRRHRRRYRLKMRIEHLDTESVEKRIFSSFRFLIACLIPLVASLFLWKIEIETDSPEVADRIETKFEKANIMPLQLLKRLPNEGEIRQLLMSDDPALSWVRFKRSGGTLTVIPMLSPKLNEKIEKDGPPSDLIARTGGVITGFQLKSGERVARVHQTVKKGDLLASGILEQGNKKALVGAEGSVYADYWAEYSFQMPKTIEYHTLGEETVELKWQSPIIQSKNGGISFQKFITFEHNREDRIQLLELTEGMEETVILPLIKYKILSETESDLKIKDENILQLAFENDTVIGTILFLMNDNIATKRPISQGD